MYTKYTKVAKIAIKGGEKKIVATTTIAFATNYKNMSK